MPSWPSGEAPRGKRPRPSWLEPGGRGQRAGQGGRPQARARQGAPRPPRPAASSGQLAKAEAKRARPARLAEAEARPRRSHGQARPRPGRRAEARPAGRAWRTPVQRLCRIRPGPRRAEVTARLDRRRAHKAAPTSPRSNSASLKTRTPARAGRPVARRMRPPGPRRSRRRHASGLMKVSAPRCAKRDPGEALVCADPSLGAADRQLTRAYQGARAAGVPDARAAPAAAALAGRPLGRRARGALGGARRLHGPHRRTERPGARGARRGESTRSRLGQHLLDGVALADQLVVGDGDLRLGEVVHRVAR